MPTESRRGVRRALLVAASSCLLGGLPAHAQIGPIQSPAEEYALPEPEVAPPPARERILPAIPLGPETRPLASGLRVRVDAFRFEGNTVFDDAALAELVREWTGREIATEELEAARLALTRHYVDAGYVSSGALVPDQEVQDGAVLVRIVEGRLTKVIVEGTKAFRPSYFESRLLVFSDRPLRIQDIEERLQVFEQDPRIERLAAQLAPGEERGEATLRLLVVEKLQFQVAAEWANDTPVGYNEETGRIGGRFSNLLGVGDRVSSLFRGSEGLVDFEGEYMVPVTPWDTELTGHVRYSEGDLVRGPFQEADVDSDALTVGFAVLQPVWRTRETEARLGVAGEWRRSQTKLGGVPFGFPGSGSDEKTGISKMTALRLGGEWVQRTRTRVVAFRQLLSFGLPILDYTNNDTGLSGEPDGEFASSLSQLRVAFRLPEAADSEIVFRTDLQLATDPLLPLEQIGVGGLATVRGYGENAFVRDQAVISSLELRVPIYRTPAATHVLQLAPFVDFAHAWNESRAFELEDETILGAGAGLRYRFRRFLRAELYWGAIVSDSEDLPSGPQDHGIHFRVRVDVP